MEIENHSWSHSIAWFYDSEYEAVNETITCLFLRILMVWAIEGGTNYAVWCVFVISVNVFINFASSISCMAIPF